MNHLVIAPVLLPLVTGSLLLLAGRAGAARRRALGLAGTALLLPSALLLMAQVSGGSYLVYALGAWPPPFGIVLVADRLSALMVVLTAVVALASLLHAGAGTDAEDRDFQALFQFQLLGINGAFLTGDLFNLFVFFEVLLIAFYALLLHGLGAQRVQSALHVVVLNLLGSALFLFGVGAIYGVTGTLNLADLARIVPQLDASAAPIAHSGALLLLGVFALKAALLPLGFWLPQAYASATGAAAALFAVLTKVGVYAILRVFPLAFGSGAGALADVAAPWLLPAALATVAFGACGALAARGLREAAGWLVVYSVGTLLAALGLFTEAGYAAAVFYLAHSTLAAAALFLVADLLARARAGAGDRLDVPAELPQAGLLGTLFMVSAVAIAGLPPLSGFAGKIMVLEAARASPFAGATWGMLLLAALVVIVSLARAGSALFWRTGTDPAGARVAVPLPLRALLPAGALLACGVALVAWGGAVTDYAWRTAGQLARPSGYVEAMLGATADDRRSLR
jgi:multicomponent K+:H+ antiporter subunit D